jgi:hypothetical protein
MKNHEKINKLLVDFVLGELSEQQTSEVKTHLTKCGRCRSQLQRLEALLECTGRIRELSADEQVCESAKQAIFTKLVSEETKEQAPRPNISLAFIGRTIMKRPITKLAAAVVIIIAVGLSIIVVESVTPVYGIADLPELLLSAKTLHVRAWSYFPENAGPGQVQRRVALESWFDLENGRSRTMSAGYNNVPMDISLNLMEKVFDGQYKMTVNHTEKLVNFEKLTPFQQELYAHQNIRDFVSQMLADPERLDEFNRTGEEVIDGIWYDIWEGEAEHPVWHHTWKVKSWIAPDTGELAHAGIWTKRGSGQWSRSYEVEKVQRNVNIPTGVFATEPPAGYEFLDTKETAQIPELNLGLTCYQKRATLKIGTKICFTMPDGSVILAWRSEDSESDVSQAEVFENLRAGGTLPKVPIEIYALKSIGGGDTISYDGRHLCYTIRNGKFYEWSIYVPAQHASARSDFLGYQTIPRFNPPQDRALFSLPVYDDLQVEDEKQFNKWVLGAMAELSDDGQAPENIAYESVIQLVGQIRESSAQ